MNRSRPVLITLVASLAFVGVAYAAIWSYEASRVRTEIARFIEARAAHGMVIHSDSLQVGGFPFELEADFGALTIDGLPYAGTARIDAPMLVARARPWRPGTWRFLAEKGFTLALTPNGVAKTVASFGITRGRAVAESGYPGSLVIGIDCHDLSLQVDASTSTAHHASLELDLPNKPPEDESTPSLGFTIVVDDAALPAGIGPKDGGLDHLAVEGVVEGPVPEQPLRPALTAWRAEGGSVELHRVALRWGAIRLSGAGTVKLDPDLQPQAAFTGSIRGWDALLEGFVRAGTLTAGDAAYYRTGLGLLTRTADDGQSELKAPITLQSEQIFLGPAKLAKLPVISWQ